ncbi:MAG: ABC-F type ribosomal protection protein [Clostridiales bacterium]|nr:ABC-F type ribosomal protection protein [Clostridiales bacterium]
MSLINISNLTFAYEGSYDNIFENASFHIDTDWKLGFTGRNGRGKTTFLNLLLGKYEHQGEITCASSITFDYFPSNVVDKSVNGIDVVDKICPNYEYWELSREMSLLEVSDEVLFRPFNTLSKGEQTKVMLSALFLKENSFLLIDEPTNHLDVRGRELVSEYLNKKKGFIIVSHDRAFLDGCIDHVLSINKNDIQIQKGDFSSWLQNKELQDNFEFSENEKLKKQVKRLSTSAKQVSEWSGKNEKTKYHTKNSGLRPDRGYLGHKSAKMMKRSKTIEGRKNEAFNEKSKLLKNIESTESLKIPHIDYKTKRLIELKNISIFYDDKNICENVSFEIANGDRINLKGKNGSGKSSILKLVKGDNINTKGNLYRGEELKISYVSQDTSELIGDLSEYAEECNIDESLFKAILRKLDFSRIQFEKDISDFSEGQKKKVLIAKSLCEKAHLYIWDEPLNYIDVISRIQIENLLLEFKPTILFVEHDIAFANKIATKVVEL